jgi:hypothetical protein
VRKGQISFSCTVCTHLQHRLPLPVVLQSLPFSLSTPLAQEDVKKCFALALCSRRCVLIAIPSSAYRYEILNHLLLVTMLLPGKEAIMPPQKVQTQLNLYDYQTITKASHRRLHLQKTLHHNKPWMPHNNDSRSRTFRIIFLQARMSLKLDARWIAQLMDAQKLKIWPTVHLRNTEACYRQCLRDH